MKYKIFYIDDKILAEYLSKYGRGPRSKDYEYTISLYARSYFENKLGENLVIAFEQNNKNHKYPDFFTPNLEQLREILNLYNEEKTPVDFLLAPTISGNFTGYAYPFQIKRFFMNPKDNTAEELATYINKKANNYYSEDVSLIIVPILVSQEIDQKGFNIQDLVNKLNIHKNTIRALYIFQLFDGIPNFTLVWKQEN